MNESFAIQGYSMSNQLLCVVDGTDIYNIDYMGNRRAIGKTMAAYNELEQTTTEYYNKLVELGVIVPPKDPQQAMEEMQKTMADMAMLIQSLSNEVKELKTHECKCNSANGLEDVPKRKSERNSAKSTTDDGGHA